MKYAKGKLLSVFCLFAASLTFSQGVFADNPYGIDYSSGEVFSNNNININPALVDDLSLLIKGDDGASTALSYHSDTDDMWQTGYISDGTSDNCMQVKYFKVTTTTYDLSQSNTYFTIANNKYESRIKFNKVVLEDMTLENGKFVPVAVDPRWGYIYVPWLFSDAGCSTSVENVTPPKRDSNDNAFVEMDIKLYDKSTQEVFTSNDLYFGVTDIDSGQSMKILNEDNLLSKDNMYALSLDSLKNEVDNGLKNKFSSSGHYIISEYNATTGDTVTSTNMANVYVKVKESVQRDGLKIVFGYASQAGSAIQYYAKQFNVKYISDSNGKITGISNEDVISGHNPVGSEEQPNDNYRFKYWIADVDIRLDDETVIRAGEPVTPEQIKHVIVDKDIEFTAVHETIESEEAEGNEKVDDESGEPIKVPDTGASTQGLNATHIALPIGIVLVVLSCGGVVYHFARKKKVDFRK